MTGLLSKWGKTLYRQRPGWNSPSDWLRHIMPARVKTCTAAKVLSTYKHIIWLSTVRLTAIPARFYTPHIWQRWNWKKIFAIQQSYNYRYSVLKCSSWNLYQLDLDWCSVGGNDSNCGKSLTSLVSLIMTSLYSSTICLLLLVLSSASQGEGQWK